MSLDINKLQEQANSQSQSTPPMQETTVATANNTPKKPFPVKNVLMGVMAVALAGSLLHNCSGPKGQSAVKESSEIAKTEQQQTLPKGITKVDKLPFKLPAFFKSEVKEVYKVGSIYVVGTLDDNGEMVYDSLTQDGKFLMATYIADAETGDVLIDSNGFIADQSSKANAESAQAEPKGDVSGLKKQSYYDNGMPDSYFTEDLTAGEYAYTPKVDVVTPAIGKLQTNPDLFARHVFDTLYNTTLHSDSLKGEFKKSPYAPIYVAYDPNCPHCQIELPQLEPLKAQGYPIIYLPIPALSDAPNPAVDEDWHYQLFAPHLGKQDLLSSLTSKSKYKKPDGFVMTEEQRKYGVNNRNVFLDMPSLLSDYYTQKYGSLDKYGSIAPLAVPTVIYMDKTTGDVHFSNLDDELLGTKIVH